MDATKEDWVEKATENVKKFLHRGGNSKGDYEQILDGVNLQNTIGYALSLVMKDPNDWTEAEAKFESMEQFCYYSGEQSVTINKIIDQMYYGLDRDVPCRITILPIEVFCGGKLYEVPLFRFKIGPPTLEWKFIDSIGRVYLSFEDFLKNNKYPSAEILFPKDGFLTPKKPNCVEIDMGKTPAWKNYYLKALDIATGIIGIAGATGAIFLTGGVATPFMAASIGSAIYATGRSLDVLRDKTAHKESLNPMYDGEARTAWLSLTAHVITFGTMGHIAAISSLASTGHSIAMGFKVCNFINEAGNVISDLVICDTLSTMHSNYYGASIETRLAHAASICFWTKSFISIKNAEKIMRNNALVALQLFGFDDTFCTHFDDPHSMDIGLRIMTNSLRHDTTVSSGADGKTIIIDGITFEMSSILKFKPSEIEDLFDVLGVVKANDREIFNQMRNANDDANMIRLITKESQLQAISKSDLIDMLLKFGKLTFEIENFKMVFEEDGIMIGNGFRISILTAYDIFILRIPSATQLIIALLHLTKEECEKFNHVIENPSTQQSSLFDWFSEVGGDDSAKIKVQISNFIEMSNF